MIYGKKWKQITNTYDGTQPDVNLGHDLGDSTVASLSTGDFRGNSIKIAICNVLTGPIVLCRITVP